MTLKLSLGYIFYSQNVHVIFRHTQLNVSDSDNRIYPIGQFSFAIRPNHK